MVLVATVPLDADMTREGTGQGPYCRMIASAAMICSVMRRHVLYIRRVVVITQVSPSDTDSTATLVFCMSLCVFHGAY